MLWDPACNGNHSFPALCLLAHSGSQPWSSTMPLTPGTKESYLGALLENIIYGFYLSAFTECCIIFRMKERKRDVKQKYVIFTAVLMFVLITTRCIIDTYHCVAAFG
ncbi:hypothetical protein B0H12DRAFT_1142310, partial [Mycena haematopus]